MAHLHVACLKLQYELVKSIINDCITGMHAVFPAAELLGTNKKTTVCFMLRQSVAGFTLSSLCAESQDRAVPETLHDVF